MDPTTGPNHPDLSTGGKSRDISVAPRPLVKAFNPVLGATGAVTDLTVGVFEQPSPKSNTI